MSNIKRITVEKINKISQKKDILCIGCGKRLNDLLSNYQNEKFVKKITMIIDNNTSIQGKSIKVGSKNLTIMSKNVLKTYQEKDYILLITSDAIDSICESIKNEISYNIKIFLYPKYYRNNTMRWLAIFSCFRCKKRLLFYAGSEPHENADAIVDYIYNNSEEQSQFRLVYLGESNQKVKTIIQEDVSQKSSFSRMIRYCYYYATSSYLFYENEALEKVNDKQKLVYLNHGTIPIKRVSDVLKQSENIDYAICPAEGCKDFYEQQYGVHESKLRYAMPARTKALFDTVDIPWKNENEALIIWLPTFRQLKGSSRCDSENDSALDIVMDSVEWNILDNILKEKNIKLLIKKHPREKVDITINGCFSNIKVVTDCELEDNGVKLNQLLGQSDALLTDYSSVAFEYMLLNKPIGYLINDIEKYHRGFAVENVQHYMPGMKIQNFDQLCQFISNYKIEDIAYSQARQQLITELFGNHACEDGAAKLITLIRGGKM